VIPSGLESILSDFQKILSLNLTSDFIPLPLHSFHKPMGVVTRGLKMKSVRSPGHISKREKDFL
jgi:hypothetical protein